MLGNIAIDRRDADYIPFEVFNHVSVAAEPRGSF